MRKEEIMREREKDEKGRKNEREKKDEKGRKKE